MERRCRPPVRAGWIASGHRAAPGPATDLMRVRRPRPGHAVRHLRPDRPRRRRAGPPAPRRQGIRDRRTRRPRPSLHAIPRPDTTFVRLLGAPRNPQTKAADQRTRTPVLRATLVARQGAERVAW